MGALTCFCNLYTWGIIKPGEHIALNLNVRDCFLSHLRYHGSLVVRWCQFQSCLWAAEVGEWPPGFGNVKAVVDLVLPLNIWLMCGICIPKLQLLL